MHTLSMVRRHDIFSLTIQVDDTRDDQRSWFPLYLSINEFIIVVILKTKLSYFQSYLLCIDSNAQPP